MTEQLVRGLDIQVDEYAEQLHILKLENRDKDLIIAGLKEEIQVLSNLKHVKHKTLKKVLRRRQPHRLQSGRKTPAAQPQQQDQKLLQHVQQLPLLQPLQA